MRIRVVRGVHLIGMLLATSLPCARAQESPMTSVTVLANGRTSVVDDARIRDDELWLPVGVASEVNGFELRDEGLCSGQVCVPVPPGCAWLAERDGRTELDVTGFARHVGQAAVADPERRVWSFGPVPALHASLASGRAPDFALPDRTGRTVHLSDFRGRKVLLLTWASW